MIFGNYTFYVGLSYGSALISVLWLCVKIHRQKQQTFQFIKNSL